MQQPGPVQRAVTAAYLGLTAIIGIAGVVTTLAGLVLLVTGAPN